MKRPLSLSRSRRLSVLGRLAGLAVVALVVAGAALVSPPPAAALEAEGAASASLTTDWLSTVGISWAGGESRLSLRLKPGADLEVANAVADDLERAGGTVGQLVQTTVLYDDGQVERVVHTSSRVLSRINVPEGSPAYEFGFQPRESVEAVHVAIDGGLSSLIISTDPTVSAAQATQIADEVVSSDHVRAVTVSVRRGVTVERGRQRTAPPAARADTTDVYEVAEQQPELIGGLEALQERVVYPELARRAGIEGQVVVQFVVNEQGRVQDPVVLRSPNDMLSRASLEAVEGLEFEPGLEDGRPVKVRFAVPVTFRLPGSDGVDRGEGAGPEAPPVRIGYDAEGNRLPVSYAGVDLERLSPGSRRAFVNTYNGIPEIYRDYGQAPGDVEVRYTIDDRGRASQAEYVAGDRSMMSMAAFLVGTLEVAENARPGPGGTFEGMLRIWYLGEG